MQFPSHVLHNFTRLRISAHNLAIETGRYAKPVATPVDKRLCIHCNQVENEFHLIFECSLYNTERNELYGELSQIISMDIYPSLELFNTIMSGLQGDLEVGKIICKYINNCFKIRSDILCYKKEKDILQRNKPTASRSGRISKRPIILDL